LCTSSSIHILAEIFRTGSFNGDGGLNSQYQKYFNFVMVVAKKLRTTGIGVAVMTNWISLVEFG
jgi:hypothetical protein